MSRLDIHRPSVLVPEDYQFIGIRVHGEGIDVAYSNQYNMQIINKHMDSTGGHYSTHAHGGSCHICGAWALTTAVFHHAPSNQYIVTGEDCCNKLEEGHSNAFKAARTAQEAQAGKRKAEDTLATEELTVAWELYQAGYEALPKGRDYNPLFEEGVIYNMVEQLVRWGSLSVKQWALMRSCVNKIPERDQLAEDRKAAEEDYAPVPVTDKRMCFTGQVVSTKVVESYYGNQLKMLVQHESGYKLWGSVPSNLDTYDYEEEKHGVNKGDMVQFMCRVTPSDDDPKFGFFQRPTKAEVLRG